MSSIPSALKLQIEREGKLVKELDLVGEIAIGRDPDCEVRLDDRAVSRKHATLKVVQGGIELKRQTAFAPMGHNGNEVTTATLLHAGDRLSVGPFTLRVVGSASTSDALFQAPEPPLAPTPVAPSPSPGEAIEFGTQPQELSAVAALPSVDAPTPTRASASLTTADAFDLEAELAADVTPAVDSSAPPAALENPVPEGGIALDPPPGAIEGGASEEAPSEITPSPTQSTRATQSTASRPSGSTKVATRRDVHVRLLFAPGIANVTEYAISKARTVIGRGSECDVVLTTKKASRQHAVIERSGMNFRIKDLGSGNGTLVNGIRIEDQELSGDDHIQIGEAEFQFVARADLPAVNTSPSLENERRQGTQGSGSIRTRHTRSFGNLPPPLTGQIQFQGTVIGSPIPNSTGKGVTNWDKFKAIPIRKKLIYGAVLIAALLFAMEGEETTIRSKSDRKVAAKPGGKKEYGTLPQEQKEFIQSQYRMAIDFFHNREFDQSLLTLKKIFELVPDYKDARDYERYAQEGKRSREELAERKRKEEEEVQIRRKVADLLDEISGLMTRREYEVAQQLFAEVQQLDPENEQIKKWQNQIEQWKDSQRVALEQERAREQIDDKARQILAQGEGQVRAGRFLAAIESLDEVKKTGTQNPSILKRSGQVLREAQKALNERVAPLMEKAIAAEQSGDLVAAFRGFRQVLKIDSRNTRARKAVNSMRETLHVRGKVLYTEGVLAESYSDFEMARKKFEELILSLPEEDIYHQRAQRKLARMDKFSEGTPQGASQGMGKE